MRTKNNRTMTFNTWAVIVLVPIFLFLLSATIIAHSRPIMHSLIETHSLDKENAKDTIDYYYTYIASDTQEPPTIEGMSEAELQHLRDVKKVWRYLLGLGALVLGLLVALLAHTRREEGLPKSLEYGSMLTIATMIGLMFMPFSAFWTWFHNIAFPQGNWVFTYNEQIIQLFPPALFESLFGMIGLLALLFGIVTYAFSFVLKKRQERRERRRKEAKTA